MAGRTLRRMGAIEFATTLAPGLRDVLLTGKAKECVNRKGPDGKPVYDAVVLDAPPTGRVVSFLDVTKAMADLAKSGPIHSQAAGVVQVLHSPLTAVHLVTLLEELPVTETLETVDELVAAGLRPGAVIANQVRPQWLPDRSVAAAANGRVDAGRIRAGLASAGLDLPADVIDGLVAETVEHAQRVHGEAAALARLDTEPTVPLARLELPRLLDGVDLGTLYELAESLREQGVGALAEVPA
jgi:anion-transporting  ArsA/GET3 family ATPase